MDFLDSFWEIPFYFQTKRKKFRFVFSFLSKRVREDLATENLTL